MNTIDFTPADNNVELTVSLDTAQYVFFHRWNSREARGGADGETLPGAWYLDLYNADLTPILIGIKLVLGTQFGEASTDPFFQNYSLSLIDTTNSGEDPGFEDLGGRVVLVVGSETELATFVQNGTSS